MSTFTTPLAVVPLLGKQVPITQEELDLAYEDGRNWRLLEEFDFASETLERIICVPVNFETDFASTPRILWPIFPPTGTYGKAAVGHDYLYRTKGVCSRRMADLTLLEMMIALCTPLATRVLMFEAVRLFGGSSYKGEL